MKRRDTPSSLGGGSEAASIPLLVNVPSGARVVVAMSGGVDSSVVAALLKAQGYDVVGITLQLYDHGARHSRQGACCAGQDIRDARRVADRLGIAHYVFDYEARFKRSVIDTFAASYAQGETPVPCIACNQTVKFTDLLAAAKEIGAAALATGHYAEIVYERGEPTLHRAADPDRDQSYFLFATTREQLSYLRFPLGAMRKTEVRALAARFALPVAAKPDSQDICFVPSGRYAEIVERLRPDACEPGEIVHVDGRLLGHHNGIAHFTIGQRRGLGIAMGEPLYVTRIDARERKVYVGPRESLRTLEFGIRNLNWLGEGPAPAACGSDVASMAVFARVRSTQEPQAATLTSHDRGTLIRLQNAERAVAPGQACVLYADDTPRARVLGGGWIADSFAQAESRAFTPRSSEPGLRSGS